MSRIAYINGRYLNHAEAYTPIEDRGYQFADGVYEYVAFYNHTFLDLNLHLARLERSLAKLTIAKPMPWSALKLVMRELMDRNGRDDGGLYMQVTRGVAKRDHPFPQEARPILSMTVCAAKLPKEHEVSKGVHIITHPDERWKHCDVKSVALLANVLAKQPAAAAGAREAWLLLPDGTVTEGAVSNAYIVTAGEGVVTHPANQYILGGVTRDVVLKLARANAIPVCERPFTLQEAKVAQEAFITSTSANVLPVAHIDGQAVGGGKPGPITRRLAELYHRHIEDQTGKRFA